VNQARGESPCPPAESVRAELNAICQSAVFQSAPRLQKLLRYLVEQNLEGNPLKESIVGVAVFGRDPGYDPKKDGVVRTEARRLRAKLIEYYAAGNGREAVVIDLPKGSYVPAFRFAEDKESSVTAAIPAPRQAWRRWVALLAAGIAATALLSLTIRQRWLVAAPKIPTRAGDSVRLRSVAVLDFRNLTARPESAWLAGAIPEMISADLANGQKVRTIPGENVSRMETELALQPASGLSRETLAAVRRNLGADIVVSGAYADLGAGSGGRIRLDIWASDARTGELIASLSESGTEPEVLDLLARAGERLRGGLHLEAAGEASGSALAPRDPAAARAYVSGLAGLRRGDFLQARDQLRRSTQLDPSFAPAHAALSSAEARLGYDGVARDEARRAYELSSTLTNDEQRRAVEAQFRDANHEPARAIDAFVRLFRDSPDNIEYGLRLARVQADGGRPQEAVRTVEALRRLPAPESADPRIDFEAAYAYAAQSDCRTGAQFADRAARAAQDAHADLLYARALSFESGLLWYLGDARWRELSETARGVCERLQDRACVAAIFRRFGNVGLASLDFDEADRDYAQALTLARQIGSAGEESETLNGIAWTSAARGNLRRAAAMQQQRVALGLQTQSVGTQQQSLANLGEVLFYEGDLLTSVEKIEAALKIARDTGRRAAVSDDLATLAQIHQARGELALSRQELEEASGYANEAGALPSQVGVLEQKARLLAAEDNLSGAQQALRDAARLGKTGVNVTAWTDPLLAGVVALAGHHPAEAAQLANEAAKAAAAHHYPSDLARAEALAAQALRMQGDRAGARAAALRAWAFAEHSQYRLVRIEAGIALALGTGAAAPLPELISEAHSLHAYQLELQARVAALELAPDRQRQAALADEAVARGFRSLARRASEIR
jgi:TolB-like protein